jgi:GT2 family glycosyltransferase
LIRALGGLRAGFPGSEEHDLALRASERTAAIRHVPRVLYHRSLPDGCAAPAGGCAGGDAGAATLRAVQEALGRRGEGGRAAPVPDAPGLVRVSYPVRGEPLVSVIIPARDGAEVLRTCLASLFTVTGYRGFEVLLVDNGSVEAATFALFEEYGARFPDRFRVTRLDIPFNFSRLNNAAAALARGELLLLLNNDIEIIDPPWLERMIGQAQRPSVGFVGARLLYPDRTIQHAGVVLGIGGVAGHGHKTLPEDDTGYCGRLKVASNCSAATAACLLVRSAVFHQTGGFDEALPVAFNDVDFCLRIRALGLLGVVVPDARLIHHESKSRGLEDTPDKRRRFHAEIRRMQERWGAQLEADPYYNPNLSQEREDFSLAADDANRAC